MGIEIERKFLIQTPGETPPWEKPGILSRFIQQGYLQNSPNGVVRVRTMDDTGFITIKGPTQNAVRKEFEYEIPRQDAEEILELCQGSRIEKQRYLMPYHGHTWEIDVFSGKNQGLIVAEIELTAPDQSFEKPPWVGREVTHDIRYCNAYLANHPFNRWKSHPSSEDRI